MAKRGGELSEHILLAAKDVFLEMGFERASMDVISARAQTSKRTLYAHFENKEKLYLAVVDLSRTLYLRRLKKPGDYEGNIEEVLVQFGGRFLEVLLYTPIVRMCRMGMNEAERFPEGSAQLFNALFSEAQTLLGSYMTQSLRLPAKTSEEAAQALLGCIIYPRFMRALFGLEILTKQLDDTINPDFDLSPVREAVARTLKSL